MHSRTATLRLATSTHDKSKRPKAPAKAVKRGSVVARPTKTNGAHAAPSAQGRSAGKAPRNGVAKANGAKPVAKTNGAAPAKEVATKAVPAKANAEAKAPTPTPDVAPAVVNGFAARKNGAAANGYHNGYIPPPIIQGPPVTFKVGDKAVHPSHGVGEVTAIEQRDIGGSKQMFYVLKILDNGMKVMVPTSAASQVGLRVIMSDKEANGILATMRAREVAVDVQPWSRRFRVYTEMIKSGSPGEVAKVLRDMNRLKFDKDLSFGERRLLDQARSLLLKELAFAKKKTEADMAEEIRQIFSA